MTNWLLLINPTMMALDIVVLTQRVVTQEQCSKAFGKAWVMAGPAIITMVVPPTGPVEDVHL